MSVRNSLCTCLLIILVATVPATTSAQSTGAMTPPVEKVDVGPKDVPAGSRQGGDTIESALVVPGLPFSDSGTTAGYTDDYDEVCPYTGSIAPDVVYAFVPAVSQAIDIDLCNSSYDTKVYVYDADLNLLACNDDFYTESPCYVYSSRLENLGLIGGLTYYIVIDGYGSGGGAYVVDLEEHVPCVVSCPPGTTRPEGEPPLVENYVDLYNGGCNTSSTHPFQHLEGALPGSTVPAGSAVLCGVSGWYLSSGANFRDTDWFTLAVGDDGLINITADADYATYVFELGGNCQDGVSVVQQAVAGPCAVAAMSIPGAAGGAHWFWVGPTVFVSPDGTMSYDYVVWFTGLHYEVLATEPTTWSTLKTLYR